MSEAGSAALAPARLEPGDNVAIIAPASTMRSVDTHLIQEAVDLLQSWELVPHVNIDTSNHFYLAGTDASRAQRFNEAVHDPSIRAIFCTRGGYGSQRLLNRLELQSAHDTLFVGFSDMTAIHLAIAAQSNNPDGLVPIHGPNVATRQLLDQSADAARNREALRSLLFEPGDLTFGLRYLRPGQATGQLLGGCLSIVASQVGTPYMPDLAGKVLFLEDVGESPYRIDRMLCHLSNAGLLDDIAGLVLGVMHDCADDHNSLEEIVLDVLHGTSFPIGVGLESGHGPRNSAIPLGVHARLDGDTGEIRLERSVSG